MTRQNEQLRQSVITWLCWNDPNGIYADEDTQAEQQKPLTLAESLEICLRQLKDGQTDKTQNAILGILQSAYVDNHKAMQQAASERGITLEQLVTSAITQAIKEI